MCSRRRPAARRFTRLRARSISRHRTAKPVSGPGYASSAHASYSSGVAATRSCQSHSHATSPRLSRKPVTSSSTADTGRRWSDPGRRTRQLLRFSRSRQRSAPLAIRRLPSSTPRTVDARRRRAGSPGAQPAQPDDLVNGHRFSLSTAIGAPTGGHVFSPPNRRRSRKPRRSATRLGLEADAVVAKPLPVGALRVLSSVSVAAVAAFPPPRLAHQRLARPPAPGRATSRTVSCDTTVANKDERLAFDSLPIRSRNAAVRVLNAAG